MRKLIAAVATVLLLIVTPSVDARQEALTKDQRASMTEILRVFRHNAPSALRVSWCESRWRSRAWSGADAGVFQINYSAHHRSGESVRQFKARFFDRKRNVAFAYRLSRGGTNWGPWTCRWAA